MVCLHRLTHSAECHDTWLARRHRVNGTVRSEVTNVATCVFTKNEPGAGKRTAAMFFNDCAWWVAEMRHRHQFSAGAQSILFFKATRDKLSIQVKITRLPKNWTLRVHTVRTRVQYYDIFSTKSTCSQATQCPGACSRGTIPLAALGQSSKRRWNRSGLASHAPSMWCWRGPRTMRMRTHQSQINENI